MRPTDPPEGERNQLLRALSRAGEVVAHHVPPEEAVWIMQTLDIAMELLRATPPACHTCGQVHESWAPCPIASPETREPDSNV